MNGLCSAERLGRDFGESKVLDFAFAADMSAHWAIRGLPRGMLRIRFELSHCLDSVLYRSLEVDSVAIEEIEGLNTKPTQALSACLLDILRVTAKVIVIGRAHTPELRCEKDLLPFTGPLEPFTEQLLAIALAYLSTENTI